MAGSQLTTCAPLKAERKRFQIAAPRIIAVRYGQIKMLRFQSKKGLLPNVEYVKVKIDNK